ncbi:hypothetical protein CEUSTIGMA_g3568.t1 [Chlamydomonas eustigma]|uniref:Phospholipase/carboxylesterase/thioesterase domain-containing protein n=1 Tax=Chlamydomonas eustigma TaxID=1157962 RepID=A0A250WZB6_9CHLO|nr:hypothetical protein CEUSTIGMA_g3568.t1 [Chlamydomonas eustigma]|eukprot:GAX76125.1 hypothetical protein CEUSTIGMA_g3568.t1 [Chlamydomonas eustigma]
MSIQIDANEKILTYLITFCKEKYENQALKLLYNYRSRARQHQRKYSAALQDALLAIKIDDKYTPAICCAASALIHLRRPKDAATLILRARHAEPDNEEVQAISSAAAEAVIKSLDNSVDRTQNAEHYSGNSSCSADHRDVLSMLDPHQPSQTPHVINLHAVQQTEGRPGTGKLSSSVPASTKCPHSIHHKAICLPQGSLDLNILPTALRTGGLERQHLFSPSPDKHNRNLLILLHGLGDTPKPYAALARRMALPQTATLALAGLLEVPESGGGRAWFEAFDEEYERIQPRPGELRRTKSLLATTAILVELVERLVSAGWAYQNIHLFGFSQGGSTALELMLHFGGAQRLGGCVSVSGALLEELLLDHVEDKLPAKKAACYASASDMDLCGPVLITHGTKDDVTSKDTIDRSLEFLRRCCGDANVRLHVVKGKGHSMVGSEAEMRALMEFWAENLDSRPSGEDLIEIQT